MLEHNLQRGLDFIVDKIKKEITAQGHVATGKLINSIRTEIKRTGDTLTGRIYIQDYGFILDKGVRPGRVPYSRGSGAGTSKYIEALIGWINIVRPGMSLMERKSFAFAIATKAKREGHPTRGSFSFSRNGRRTNWSEHAIKNNRRTVVELMDLAEPIAAMFRDMVNKINSLP